MIKVRILKCIIRKKLLFSKIVFFKFIKKRWSFFRNRPFDFLDLYEKTFLKSILTKKFKLSSENY